MFYRSHFNPDDAIEFVLTDYGVQIIMYYNENEYQVALTREKFKSLILGLLKSYLHSNSNKEIKLTESELKTLDTARQQVYRKKPQYYKISPDLEMEWEIPFEVPTVTTTATATVTAAGRARIDWVDGTNRINITDLNNYRYTTRVIEEQPIQPIAPDDDSLF